MNQSSMGFPFILQFIIYSIDYEKSRSRFFLEGGKYEMKHIPIEGLRDSVSFGKQLPTGKKEKVRLLCFNC